MQLDERAYNFIQKAKQAGATKEQVANFLRDKGYDVVYNQEQSQEETTERPSQEETVEQQTNTEEPGLIEGFGKEVANAFAIGQGSRIAGLLNTAPGRVLKGVINPAGTILSGPKEISSQDFSPESISKAYQEGKQQFEQSQEQYKKEHPTASMIGEGVGTVGGFLVPAGAVGGAVRGGVAATRLGRAGRVGMLASRAAGEITTGALYEGVREGFGEGRADAEAALKGAGKGAALFGALGILGGGARVVEENLVSTAVKLAENPANNKILRAVMEKVASHPVAAERSAMAAGLAAEGTTLGALPAYLNDQEITAKDIGTGLAFAAGGRGAAEVASWAGGKLRKFANEPTKMQAEEARAIAERINQADIKEQEALGNLMAVGRERAALERQYGVAEEARKLKAKPKESELTYETTENGMNPVVDESKKKWDYYYGKLLEDLEKGKSSGYSVYKDEDTSGFFRGLADDYEDAVRQHNEHIKLLKEDRLKKLGRVKTQAAKDKIEKEFNQRVSDADKMLENSKKSVINQVKELEQELYGGEDFVDKTLKDNRYVTLSNGVRINLEQYNNLDELLNEFPKAEAREIFNKIINDERVLQLADKAIPISDKISKMKKEGQSFWDALEANPKEYNEFAKIAKEQARLQLEIAKEIIRNKQQPARPISRVVQEKPVTKIDEEIPLDTSLISEAKKTEKFAVEKLNRAEQELGDVLSGTQKDLETNVQVSATEKEIADYMKSHSKNPYMTEEKAAFNIRQAKERAARQITPQEKLPLQERFLRKSKEIAGKVIGQFNLTRPLQEGITKSEMVTGTKVAADKNPVIRLNKLRNGGEQEALIAPVYDTAKSVEKQYPGSIDGADIVLDAEKRIQFARNDGKVPDQRFLDIVEQYKDDAPVQQIVKEVRDLNQKALDRLYESGRIDKATYEDWKKNDAYVPSWIEKYDEAGEQTVGNLREQYLRQYTGEGDVYQNPIFTSMQQAKQLDTFAELQTAKKEYLELASKTGDATKVPSTTEYTGGPVKFDKANQIVVWKEGQPEIWNVPEKVAQYFNPEKKGIDSLPVKVAKALFGFPLRLYKGGTTAVSMGFSQNNIVRDVQGAVIGSKNGAYIGPDMIRSSIKELIEEAPIAKELGKQIGTQTLRDVEQLPGLAKDNVKNFVDMYKAIDKAGGEGTQRGIIARLFTTALPNGARKLARVSSKTSSATLDALSYAGNLGEETTRLSVFKSELKAAAQDQAQYDMWIANPDTIPSELRARAGEAAREVTLNFRRQMAPWVEDANRYFLPYFKPSILGAMRGFEVLTNPEIAPKAWRSIMNIGILQGLVNGKLVDKKQLENLEAYNNEMSGKNFLMRNSNGTLITIPLSQEFAPLIKMFAGVTEMIYRKATKQQRQDIGREMVQAGKQMLENYVPGLGYFTEPSNLVVGQIPKAVVEEWVNKDIFSGTPIVSEYLMNRPASLQYTKSTPQTLVQASKWLAKHGVEISPMRLNHIAKTFGSNTAKEMLTLTDAALEANGIGELRPRKEVTDNPLVRRFVANLMAPYNQYNQDARRIIEENKGGYELVKNKELEGLPKQQRDRYIKQYLTYKRAESSINNLNQLRKKRKGIERKIAIVGNALKTQYEKGKIDKSEYIRRRNKTINAFNTVLDTQNQLERQFQLEIIKAEADTKKKK